MQSFVADISAGAIPQILRVKQGDSMNRFFQLTLTDGGAAWQPPEGAVYTVRFATDKSSGWYDTIRLPDGGSRPAVEAQGNRLTVELAMQAAAGNGELCLVVNDALGYQLAAWNITIQTEPVPGADSQEAQDYYGVLAGQISQVAQDASAAAASAAAAEKSAADAKQSALAAKGHTIQDGDGTAMEQRAALQFVGFQVNDDPSGKTIVSPQTAGDTKNVAGYVGEVVFFADEQLRENHVWADGGTIDPAKWPELAAYAASAGWQTDESSGLYKTPDFRGRFLLTQSDSHAVGSSGGEETHKLTTEELPAHTHEVCVDYRTFYMSADEGQARKSGDLISESGTGVKSYTTVTTGGSQAHNNMPPYYVVTAQIRAKVDEITAKVVEVNGNTLAAFEDGQVLAQQGGRIRGQAGALKTYSSVTQLGLTAAQVTTAQVYAALGGNAFAVIQGTEVSDPPTDQCVIVFYCLSQNRGRIIAYSKVHGEDYMMALNSASSGATGKWRKLVSDAYHAGDKVVFSSSLPVGGGVTGGGTHFFFTVPLLKPIHASKVTFSGKARIRQNGNYLFGTSESRTDVASIPTKQYEISPSGIVVDWSFSEAPNNVQNNSATSVEFDGTFTFS